MASTRCIAAAPSYTLLMLLSLAAPQPLARAAGDGRDVRLVEVRRIWDAAPHNAFTDLVRFKGRWYCVFREGRAHVSPDGKLRVLESLDGKQWASAALISLPDADLRDAKACVTPDGKLMLSGAAARPALGGKTTHQSMAWFSADGRTWDAGTEIGDKDFWLWRVTWHGDAAYAVGYGCAADKIARLYSSRDGRRFETLVPTLFSDGYPNEHALLFLDDGTCLCLLRRDAGTKTGQLGTSKTPYKQWSWKDLGRQIGGPEMIRTADGRLLAGVRLYDGKVRTSLCWVDAQKGTLDECLTFPSGGDTSYPGLVMHDGLLWVSYYSSHEGKTSIYLATVTLDAR
jgi:hypothetical protein